MCMFFFFFRQKTAYEMRISDWSSDVCSSDLLQRSAGRQFESDYRLIAVSAAAAASPANIFAAYQARAGTPVVGNRVFLQLQRYKLGFLSGPLVKIGRASCRERVCQYVQISVVAVSLKKKIQTSKHIAY